MVILAGFGSALVGLGTPARSTVSIEEATRADPRAPVLYLRAFRQEHLAFISGPKSRYGQYASKEVLALSTGDDTQDDSRNVEVRFERYFREALNTRIGPFVALGNPEDYVPLEGAARTYASDSEWMQHVEKLVTECSCIVAEIGISSNLAWELKYLLERGFQQKLFIMTRPVSFKSNWVSRFIIWTMQIQVITWNDFANTMNAAGYEVGSEPGPGSVLTFDATGKLVVLKKGAFTPEEFDRADPRISAGEFRIFSGESRPGATGGSRRASRIGNQSGQASPQVVMDQAGYLCGRLLCRVLPDSKRVQQGTAIQREVARRRAPVVCIANKAQIHAG